MSKIELLAPAGSMEALEAAVESGADAVYIGGTKFNARAFANNLDEDLLVKAVEYAHIRGVKVYVTVNIIILQRELQEVMEYIRYLYSIHVDAVIVQDIGLAVLIRKLLPDFEVHCSTQMAIHNTDGAMLLNELGIKRVVLARELSLQEINRIVEDTDIDAEIFIHGALCVCYSGQCYMSSFIGGRSGNRGKCAQPCRKKYRFYDTKLQKEIQPQHGDYLISTRDLNTYENLYDIAASKAVSFKVEGRMKRPEYVAIIMHHYRQALDCIQRGETGCISEQAEYELRMAFNREFTKGYLFNKRNQEIVNTERPDNRGIYIGRVLSQKGNMAELLLENNFLRDGDSIEVINKKGKNAGCTISGIKKEHNTVKFAAAGDKIRIFITDRVAPGSIVNKTVDSELFQKARDEYAFPNKKKIGLFGVFTGKINETPILSIKDDAGNFVQVVGDETIQAAQKLTVTDEKIAEQLNKTKDTPFYFEQLDIQIENNSFLSVKAINNLRREAIEKISQQRILLNRPKVDEASLAELNLCQTSAAIAGSANKELIAGVISVDAGMSAIRGGADTLYILGSYNYHESLELIKRLAKPCEDTDCSLFYVMPQITRNAEAAALEGMLKQGLEIDSSLGLVISNISHIKMAERLKCKRTRSSFALNITNSASAGYLAEKGVESIAVSPELNLTQIKELQTNVSSELEAMVHGYLPAMITEYCPSTAVAHCETSERGCNKSYGMLDERNKLFKVMSIGNCKNIIMNSDVLCAYDHLSNIIDSGISKLRMDFYFENEQEVHDIVKAYKNKMSSTFVNISEDVIESIKAKGYTKGHYFRGID